MQISFRMLTCSSATWWLFGFTSGESGEIKFPTWTYQPRPVLNTTKWVKTWGALKHWKQSKMSLSLLKVWLAYILDLNDILMMWVCVACSMFCHALPCCCNFSCLCIACSCNGSYSKLGLPSFFGGLLGDTIPSSLGFFVHRLGWKNCRKGMGTGG